MPVIMNSPGMQAERETWRENGLAPPMPGTDAEKTLGQRWTKLCLSQRCAISIMVLFQIALQSSRLRFNTVLTISQ